MILVFVETENNSAKKASLEAICLGYRLAEKLGTTCSAVVIGSCENDLGKYGANTVISVNGSGYDYFSPEAYSAAISEVAKKNGATTLIFAGSYSGKSLAPKVAVKLEASLTTGVVAMPEVSSGLKVRKTCFSNKAFTEVSVNADVRVLSFVPNSFEVVEQDVAATSESFAYDAELRTKSLGIDVVKGKIPLTEAELVVSAGRGLKGPENWGMIEELADLLGAATACSKPVSDMGWRPHSEHVGQTGITIKPNLYIAIGISGAIQHLAGVSSSKVICVINTDPEAPFFKAADYGIVGDAFEVVPKLIAQVKALQAS
ncbi:MAG: electron transfer flavoprotein alpha subunit [Bacteroidia bacterium]|jgi:electron transfer flavoprotein alpha subunit